MYTERGEQASAARATKDDSLDIDNGAQPFRAPKTAELVARELRNRIIRGELQEGETLPGETELMQQFSISRPTLRETLRILESQSLLTVTRGSREGPRVHLPDPRQVACFFGYALQSRDVRLTDIYDVRSWIEPAIVYFIAQHATDDDIARLRAIVAEQRRASDDPVAHSRAVVAFHKALIELSGNRVLTFVMAILNHVFDRNIPTATLTRTLQKADAEASENTVAANAHLVDLIERRDASAAEQFWREYHEKLAALSRRVLPLDARIEMPD